MGSLAETPLPALLVGLHRDAYSGALALRRGNVVKRFEWRSGAPVGVRSRLPAERLCEILAAGEGFDAAARARVEQTVAERGWSELQALAGLQVVPPRVLVLALAEQLRRSLSDCLAWRDGEFRLEPGEAAAAPPALPFDLLALVVEIAGRTWQRHEILMALGPHALSYPTLVPGLATPWLPGELRDRLLPRLDGQSASFALLNELADVPSAAAFWVLDALGALVHRAEPGKLEAEPEEIVPEIEVVVQQASSSRAADAAPRAAKRSVAPAPAAAEALRREVQALHLRLGSVTLWEVLGVARDADARAVRRAYLNAAKRLHPDRVMQLGLAELKAQANELFAEITRAHDVLSDPERRQHYEETLVDSELADGDRIAEAEAAFRRGELLLRAGNFRAAVELLERAVTLWPEEAEYHAALAWALHRKAPPESARAWEHFQRALADAEQAQWLLRASLVARELGDEANATKLGARARALDPQVKA